MSSMGVFGKICVDGLLTSLFLALDIRDAGYPFSPGHYATSITHHEDLMALPGQGQRIDLR